MLTQSSTHPEESTDCDCEARDVVKDCWDQTGMLDKMEDDSRHDDSSCYSSSSISRTFYVRHDEASNGAINSEDEIIHRAHHEFHESLRSQPHHNDRQGHPISCTDSSPCQPADSTTMAFGIDMGIECKADNPENLVDDNTDDFDIFGVKLVSTLLNFTSRANKTTTSECDDVTEPTSVFQEMTVLGTCPANNGGNCLHDSKPAYGDGEAHLKGAISHTNFTPDAHGSLERGFLESSGESNTFHTLPISLSALDCSSGHLVASSSDFNSISCRNRVQCDQIKTNHFLHQIDTNERQTGSTNKDVDIDSSPQHEMNIMYRYQPTRPNLNIRTKHRSSTSWRKRKCIESLILGAKQPDEITNKRVPSHLELDFLNPDNAKSAKSTTTGIGRSDFYAVNSPWGHLETHSRSLKNSQDYRARSPSQVWNPAPSATHSESSCSHAFSHCTGSKKMDACCTPSSPSSALPLSFSAKPLPLHETFSVAPKDDGSCFNARSIPENNGGVQNAPILNPAHHHVSPASLNRAIHHDRQNADTLSIQRGNHAFQQATPPVSKTNYTDFFQKISSPMNSYPMSQSSAYYVCDNQGTSTSASSHSNILPDHILPLHSDGSSSGMFQAFKDVSGQTGNTKIVSARFSGLKTTTTTTTPASQRVLPVPRGVSHARAHDPATSASLRDKSRERREQDAVASPRKSGLPPCRVCGDRASGLHFGVNSCEACNEFYRRTLKRNSHYACAKGGQCDVMGRKRSSCSYCRFQKCLSLGMSRSAIKTGRYSHQKRTQYTMEIKSMERSKARREEERRMNEMTRDLLLKHKHFFMIPRDQRPEEVGTPHHFRPMTSLYDVMTEQFLEEEAHSTEEWIRQLIKFVKHVDIFEQITLSDQASLIRMSWFEIRFLDSFRHYYPDDQIVSDPNGRCMSFDQLASLHSRELAEEHFRLAAKLKRLRPTQEELVLMKCLYLTLCDRDLLSDRVKITALNEFITTTLTFLLTRNHHGNAAIMFSRIVDCFIQLRSLAWSYFEGFSNFYVHHVTKNSQLLAEMIPARENV